ncbi:possible glyoxylate reductase [Weissella oryzae SG25]|uniref:Possible glyoxylate reductase n=1 Tax=Weissella oryzae (strain DSM 25784 / JCM 18191 / LMG 30913 / SG25) TaxID=1329250 RepID=A0A069CYL8_WEIOS|nr:NAD(P)-dependent oxidoreductase [Weissella oryzae]GAK30181.1 possible glyoxylate reductase [Weissella oryzae SG25]
MAKVLITAELPESTYRYFDDSGIEVVAYQEKTLITHKQLLDLVLDVDYIISALSTTIDREIIDAAPKLKFIANFGAGYNNIDVAYAKSKQIFVSNTPLVSTNSVAEVTLGLILDLNHRITEGDKVTRSGKFTGWAPTYFLGNEIAGKTLGVFGFGNIGQAVARKAVALSMKIQYWQPRRLSDPEERDLGAKYVPFDELVKTSDVISINAPLNSTSRHRFDLDVFKAMKNTAQLINVGRGPIVDESDLVIALKQGMIAGAPLDVYENEPEVDAGLIGLDNVVLTPHIGNATVEARDAMAKIVAQNILAVNQDKPTKFIVNN